jgi:hypothetical protein
VGLHQHPWAISADGQKKWGRVSGEDYPFETSPVVLENGSICCVSTVGMLTYVSPEGDHKWMYYLYAYDYGSPAVGPTGAIYVPDLGGNLNALRAGVVLARTPWPKFRDNARNTGNLQDATR